MSQNRDVVFWSGGLDSTLVAVDLLRARKNTHLITFTNESIGGYGQQQKERIRRKRIIQRLKTEFGNKITHEDFTWDGRVHNGCLGQASMWLSVFPLVLQDDDTAYFGVIRYSDFWHKKEEFETAFNAVCKFQDKKVKLEYPLEWSHKNEIKKRLKKVGYLEIAIHSGDKL